MDRLLDERRRVHEHGVVQLEVGLELHPVQDLVGRHAGRRHAVGRGGLLQGGGQAAGQGAVAGGEEDVAIAQ